MAEQGVGKIVKRIILLRAVKDRKMWRASNPHPEGIQHIEEVEFQVRHINWK